MCCLVQIIAFTAGWRMTLVVLATLPLTVAAYGVQSRFLIGFSAQVSFTCFSCSSVLQVHAAGLLSDTDIGQHAFPAASTARHSH